MAVRSNKGKVRNGKVREVLAKMATMDTDKRQEVLSLFKTALDKKWEVKTWRAIACVPNVGPLTKLIGGFEKYTDAPLELPLFCAFHLISGMLLAKGSKLDCVLGEITPETWSILLAPSGSGKTLMYNAVSKGAIVKSDFPECASSSAFFSALKEANGSKGYGLWFQDQFAQTLKQIETLGSPLAETKSYLLRTYSNETINRTTKKEGQQVIENPKLGFLGMNTRDSFMKAISLESMLDGFAQRFAVVFADEDPKRPMTNFPHYELSGLKEVVDQFWQSLNEVGICETYRLDPKALELYDQKFKEFYNDQSKGFYRRLMFRAFKYAMIYHILVADSSNTINEGDMELALRVVKLHLQDTAHFIAIKDGTKEFCETLGKVEQTIAKALGSNPGLTEAELTAIVARANPDWVADSKQANFFVKFLGLNPAQRAVYQNLGVERAKDF